MTTLTELLGTETDAIFKEATQKQRIRCNRAFTCYPLAQLDELVEEISTAADETAEIELRYLVDHRKDLWFAKEGVGPTDPQHDEMTKKSCLAAGNVRLTYHKATKCITFLHIDNKSGGFHPEYQRIKWFLLILLLNPSPHLLLKDPLEIERLFFHRDLISDDEAAPNTYTFNRSELSEWKDAFATDFLKTLQQQPTEIKIVSHNKTKFFPPGTDLAALLPTPSGSDATIAATATPV